MAFSNWYPLGYNNYKWILEKELYSQMVRPGNTDISVTVVTDSKLLFDYCAEYMVKAPASKPSDAVLYYLLHTDDPVSTPRGIDSLRRLPEAPAYDAAIDPASKSILYAGSLHYGLLKSIVSGLQSFCLANSFRQGLHAAAFSIGQRGILLVGGAGSGKTNILLRAAEKVTKITSEDWCDIVLDSGRLSAVGIEPNVSFNISDLPILIGENLIPKKLSSYPHIPHGHRDKVVAGLDDVFPNKTAAKLMIQEIYLLSDVSKPTVLEKPDSRWLYEVMSSVSTHMPFCYPVDEVCKCTDWKALAALHGTDAIIPAEDAIRQRVEFFEMLADLIFAGECRLVLLPSDINVSLQEKANQLL